jgi:hypothetical protein
MSLIDLVDNTHTLLFVSVSAIVTEKKETATHVLEVGIQCGGQYQALERFLPKCDSGRGRYHERERGMG